MRKLDCYESFARGSADREKSPLPRGLFKLREIGRWFQADLDGVIEIENHLLCKSPYPRLLHCTPEDKHIWLKRLPGYLSYQLSYKILAGVNALAGDDIDEATIQHIKSWVESRVKGLLVDLEQTRRVIAKNIGHEYTRMRCGGGLLKPLLEEIVRLVQDILELVDTYHLQEVSEK